MVPDAGAVLVRFPVPVAAFAVLAGTFLLYPNAWSTDWLARWAVGWSATALCAIAIAFTTEALTGRAAPIRQSAGFFVGTAAAVLYSTTWLSAFWLHAALFGAILLAPASRGSDQELWSFNTRLCAMAIFAGIATTILVIGVILIAAATQYLFGLGVTGRYYGRIATFGYVCVMPVYWLALAPRFDAPPLGPRDLLAKVAASLGALVAGVTVIMAPLLHAYAGKIALAGELPKNQVGWIVSLTLSAGLYAWLLSAGEAGPAAGFRRAFRRWWFALTIVPVVLLAAAIFERIEAYGVTIDRYVVSAAAAASLAMIVLALVRRGSPSVRSVLGLSVAFAILAAVGPLNMSSVVAASQTARLKSMLAAAGVLRDGRIEAPLQAGSWSRPQALEIVSMTQEIYNVGAQDKLKPMMPVETLETADRMQRFLAADYGSAKAGDARFAEIVSSVGATEVGAGVLIGPFSLSLPNHGGARLNGEAIEGRVFRLEARRLVVDEGARDTVFDLAPLDVAFDRKVEKPLPILSTDGRSTLIVTSVRLQKSGDAISVGRIAGFVVIGKT